MLCVFSCVSGLGLRKQLCLCCVFERPEHLSGQEWENADENGKIDTSGQPREDVGWENQRWNRNQEG